MVPWSDGSVARTTANTESGARRREIENKNDGKESTGAGQAVTVRTDRGMAMTAGGPMTKAFDFGVFDYPLV